MNKKTYDLEERMLKDLDTFSQIYKKQLDKEREEEYSSIYVE